ncbi:hypothetical protein ACEQ8H_001282 [Pleosporales sp. CAS-2024a]
MSRLDSLRMRQALPMTADGTVAWQQKEVPIPFSVFPSAYRNAHVEESTTTSVHVEGEVQVPQHAQHGGEAHEETHESFSATLGHPPQPAHRDTYVKEEVRITEQERLGRPQHHQTEQVRITEHTRYTQPDHHHQQPQQHPQPQHSKHPQQHRKEFQEFKHASRDRPDSQPPELRASKPPQHASPFLLLLSERHAAPHFSLTSSSLPKLTFHLFFSHQPPSSSSSHTHVEVQERAYDRHFDTVHGPATDYAPSQIDVSERQFRERTRPIVAEHGYTRLDTHAHDHQASRYTRETIVAKDTSPYQGQVDSVDAHYPPPAQVRVEKTTRSTVGAPKKFKRDMGYYDNEGQYHSFRHGISDAAHKVAHKVADRVAHPIHPNRHHHSHSHSNSASKYDDLKEEIIVKEQYTTAVPPAPIARPVSSGAPVERVVRVTNKASYPAPSRVAYSSTPKTNLPSAPATARKMSSPNTITIPCHHIRIGDLLILQGRPCQVIRITTSSQTGQHRYLGVDLFTKQLHEESSFISNPAPSVIVQNMLGPVFKQYRVLDIREDGRVVAMTEGGDVKQGLPVLDQSSLLTRLTEAFDNGRGSVRILVINDDGMEMAVDYKVVHGSRL